MAKHNTEDKDNINNTQLLRLIIFHRRPHHIIMFYNVQ